MRVNQLEYHLNTYLLDGIGTESNFVIAMLAAFPGRASTNALFESECGDSISADSATRGDEAGQNANGQQHHGDAGYRHRIRSLNPEQQTANCPAEKERGGDTGAHAKDNRRHTLAHDEPKQLRGLCTKRHP